VAAQTVKSADIGVSAQFGPLGRRYSWLVGRDETDDPFEGVRFDNLFVRSAPHREASAEVRAARARAARLAHDLTHSMAAEGRRGARRARRRTRWTALVTVAAVALVVAQARGDGGGNAFTALSGGFVQLAAGDERPTPTSGSRGGRLLPLPLRPAPEGSHAFTAMQPGGDDPVAYDPCRPIAYVVNDRTAPQGAAAMIEEAIAEVSSNTGLRFEYEGLTDERPTWDRSAFQEDRYGDRWAPVLVAWTDDVEDPGLAETIIGRGGSTSVPGIGTKERAYVSGMVTLDGPDMARVMHRDGWASARAVVEHELGHVLGLDHVESARELMNAENQVLVSGFQAGDKVGLQRLGDGRCFDRL
jgi:hypothetical protein